ncbi:MAG: SDR family oxidoreductase [Chitinophagaceae bacterium]|nr:SDR family oxidoreductase [Chitinophagaceae bacterium]
MINLTGETALITGGGSGIGLGIVKEMIGLGAKVVLTGRTEEKLRDAQKMLGENCFYCVNDVTDKKHLPVLIQDIEKNIGAISILVNNAGRQIKKPSLDTTDAEFDEVINTNLSSVFALTREVLKYMIPRKKGSVLFISSMTAFYGLPQVLSYSASKSALFGLLRTLTVEYAHTGVRFNARAPGFIESKMMLAALDKDPSRKEKILSRTPVGRFGDAADIGKAAAFLASDAAAFITGVCLPVDGGNSIGF